jgi:hypothetical protein
MSNRMQTVLPRQFYGSLPQRFRKLGPMWLLTSKPIQLALQLHDRLGDGQGALVVQCQPTSADD